MAHRICITEGCDNPLVARGLCGAHYGRARSEGRLGEFKKLPRPRLTLRERFERIGWTTTHRGCWEWNGFRNSRGYGQVNSGSKSNRGDALPALAPRVAWSLYVGEIPEGLVVCHKCDNPPCVNPGHLFLGTRADNNADMVAKKRTINGERRPQSKLTDAQVAEIRARYEAGGVTQKALGNEYGVSASAVSTIVNFKRRATPTRWDGAA